MGQPSPPPTPNHYIDPSFRYFVERKGHFAISDPPSWTLRRKIFDFSYLTNNEETAKTHLSAAQMGGGAPIWFNMTLGRLAPPFRVGGRVYIEWRWDGNLYDANSTSARPAWALRSQQARNVLAREVLDILDSDDTGAALANTSTINFSSSSLSLTIVLIGAFVALAALIFTSLVLTRRKKRREDEALKNQLLNQPQ